MVCVCMQGYDIAISVCIYADMVDILTRKSYHSHLLSISKPPFLSANTLIATLCKLLRILHIIMELMCMPESEHTGDLSVSLYGED